VSGLFLQPFQLNIEMRRTVQTLGFLAFKCLLLPTTIAAIGPTADLTIQNAVISPDGFNRSYVAFLVVSSFIPVPQPYLAPCFPAVRFLGR